MALESLKTDAADPDAPGRFAAARTVLLDAVEAHAFPGCAFGAWASGRVMLCDALGRFTYEPEAPSVSADTVFDVASLTKVVATTAAAMLLYQRGQLDLDTPLADLLPGFVIGRARGDQARHVRLRHLLAHNSGLPGYVKFFETARTPAALYRACLELPLEAEPGARAEYSDPGFILLGKALEVIAGEGLAAFIHREVFAPLGMGATCFNPPPSTRAAIPPTEEDTAFRHRRMQGEVQDENAWILKGVAGHAGLFSTVPDLLRFAAAILKAEILKAEVLKTETLKAETLKSAFGHQAGGAHSSLFAMPTLELFSQRQGPQGSSRALGWDTPSQPSSSGTGFSAHSIGHLGYSGCSLWIDLEKAVAVVLLTNRTWPDRKSQLIRQVRPAFHNALVAGIERVCI